MVLYNNHEFTVIRHDRSGSARGGGVCIFIRNTLNFSVVSLPAAYEHLEVVCGCDVPSFQTTVHVCI
jgi:hypothetical protein